MQCIPDQRFLPHRHELLRHTAFHPAAASCRKDNGGTSFLLHMKYVSPRRCTSCDPAGYFLCPPPVTPDSQISNSRAGRTVSGNILFFGILFRSITAKNIPLSGILLQVSDSARHSDHNHAAPRFDIHSMPQRRSSQHCLYT